ncbi:aminomethyl-transferring glycine dehydrogenase subunit GcvPA [Acidovorax sp. D2M1]|uniref:Aminomethyl-transferring glycine dehydrogenase subunit GcvPA n=1 Tax=Acidovorax benzenivorans TaxID=2987520 RepID=A0ABT5RVE8_9BURK|nr:aminomethyl-transferring glycine dehydrogenase subunit GcvPA [Acidovorax benzenivorans]MDD2177156.1 aminomethyl-transferring glycine dehydrogenase subunit GcvPA [Acidovorax benzenivorans]
MTEQTPAGFNVHTGSDVQAMLAVMGLHSIEQLFADVPAQVRLRRALSLPSALSEWELMRDMRAMADMNATVLTHSSFLGCGAYEHYIPAVVDAMVSRGEFLTAYTPYQPEMSQGLLQALFEFQVLVGRLLGQDCVNCSVYDGATALAESCWMMCSASGKRRVVVAQAVWQQYREVLDTYLLPRGVQLVYVGQDLQTGMADTAAIADLIMAGDVAGVVLQSPNALGVIEDLQAVAQVCQSSKALLVVCVNPLLCGWLEAPGRLGADIVVCEGQPLGLPLSAGGPYVGIIACTKTLERYLPGRLVGRVHDLNGKLGYALVKEDREQHVARDRATSHICSNQALNAIRVAIYLACLGERNFMRIAQMNVAKAAQLRELLTAQAGVKLLRRGSHFNEFAVELPMDAVMFCARMRNLGIFAGVPIDKALVGHERGLLIAVTETKSLADLQAYVKHACACLQEF